LGLGWVVRRSDGSCLGAATRIIRARSAIEAEARGLESVLWDIAKYNGQEMIIEMDTNMVVQALKKKNFSRIYWGKIARRCDLLLRALPNASLKWIRRTGNNIAHSLAKWAIVQPNMDWTTVVTPLYCHSYPQPYEVWVFCSLLINLCLFKKKKNPLHIEKAKEIRDHLPLHLFYC
jgi:ribonuclease HI